MAVVVHADRAVIGAARGRCRQTGCIAGAVRPGVTGGQRSGGIACRRRQCIGHHDFSRCRGDHAVAVGGGEGHRVRAHEPAVGHVGISAVGTQGHMAVAGSRLSGGGQPGAVADIDGSRDAVLSGPSRAGRGIGQSIGYDHLRRNHRGLTSGPVRGGKGNGIGTHEPLRRRIGIMAVTIHADRAVPGLAHRRRRQGGRIAGAVRPGKTGRQTAVSVAGAGLQDVGYDDRRLLADRGATVGRGEGYRVGTHKPRIGHIGIGAVAVQRNRTVLCGSHRVNAKTQIVADRIVAGDAVLCRTGSTRHRFRQDVGLCGDGHEGRGPAGRGGSGGSLHGGILQRGGCGSGRRRRAGAGRGSGIVGRTRLGGSRLNSCRQSGRGMSRTPRIQSHRMFRSGSGNAFDPRIPLGTGTLGRVNARVLHCFLGRGGRRLLGGPRSESPALVDHGQIAQTRTAAFGLPDDIEAGPPQRLVVDIRQNRQIVQSLLIGARCLALSCGIGLCGFVVFSHFNHRRAKKIPASNEVREWNSVAIIVQSPQNSSPICASVTSPGPCGFWTPWRWSGASGPDRPPQACEARRAIGRPLQTPDRRRRPACVFPTPS